MSYIQTTRPWHMAGFTKWLIVNGHKVHKVDNPWVLLRMETKDGDGIFQVYRNKKGRVSWPPEVHELYETYLKELS